MIRKTFIPLYAFTVLFRKGSVCLRPFLQRQCVPRGPTAKQQSMFGCARLGVRHDSDSGQQKINMDIECTRAEQDLPSQMPLVTMRGIHRCLLEDLSNFFQTLWTAVPSMDEFGSITWGLIYLGSFLPHTPIYIFISHDPTHNLITMSLRSGYRTIFLPWLGLSRFLSESRANMPVRSITCKSGQTDCNKYYSELSPCP